MRRPVGVFGVGWGAPLSEARVTLGIACEQRYAWRNASDFHVCRGQSTLIGYAAWIEVITRQERVEGILATFIGTPCPNVAASLRQELRLPRNVDPISLTWRSGETIRLDETTAGCKLTVAGPRWGMQMQREQLAQAFASVTEELRP